MDFDVAASGITVDIVRRLVDEQVPELADEPLVRSAESGSSNVVFRLGQKWAVRLPRSARYARDLQKELRWLPQLHPSLSVPIPVPHHQGRPTAEFPFEWAVMSWVPGTTPDELDADAQERLAVGLGRFTRELHAIDASGLPSGIDVWGYRCGDPVTDEIDDWASSAAAELTDLYDPSRVAEAWRRIRDVPPSEVSCWVHTDLAAENLLVSHAGDLAGVIDFGGLGVGDPAVDLLYAWGLFDPPARETLRRAARVDDATWARARAWSFVGPGLLSLAHYRDSMPTRAARLRRMVEAAAADVGVVLR